MHRISPVILNRWAMKLWRDYLNTENETVAPAVGVMNE